MRILTSLLTVLIISFCNAQNAIDFKDISTKVSDSAGQYNYEKLLYKFIHLPSSLDSVEAKHLYYGKNFHPKLKDKIVVIGDFLQLARTKKYQETIAEGEKVFGEDPVSLEVLGALCLAYQKGDPQNKMLPLRATQFRVLVKAVLDSAEEKEKGKLYTTMSVADEYIVGGILGYDLHIMRRRSEKVKNGIIDHWKFGKKNISFLITYLEK